jgi:hypothetical protein
MSPLHVCLRPHPLLQSTHFKEHHPGDYDATQRAQQPYLWVLSVDDSGNLLGIYVKLIDYLSLGDVQTNPVTIRNTCSLAPLMYYSPSSEFP